jgi:CTD kinase subunit gamma
MNNRANIMYFIEHLCDLSLRENHLEYVRMMQRDILRVIDAVAPPDGSGAANVKVVRRVLAGLQAKEVLMPETVLELEALLKERDIAPSHPFISGLGAETNGAKRTAGRGLDKVQIQQRIEEDRERHKRLRESIWAVPAAGGDEDVESEKLWEEGSDIGEDDSILGKEDRGERRQGIVFG